MSTKDYKNLKNWEIVRIFETTPPEEIDREVYIEWFARLYGKRPKMIIYYNDPLADAKFDAIASSPPTEIQSDN